VAGAAPSPVGAFRRPSIGVGRGRGRGRAGAPGRVPTLPAADPSAASSLSMRSFCSCFFLFLDTASKIDATMKNTMIRS
jgi:hypothetical protein